MDLHGASLVSERICLVLWAPRAECHSLPFCLTAALLFYLLSFCRMPVCHRTCLHMSGPVLLTRAVIHVLIQHAWQWATVSFTWVFFLYLSAVFSSDVIVTSHSVCHLVYYYYLLVWKGVLINVVAITFALLWRVNQQILIFSSTNSHVMKVKSLFVLIVLW